MSDLSDEPDQRAIRDYVNSQSPEDDQVTLVQAVGSQRILGRRHDLYDVHCASSRWWVITDPTNLYQQSTFPQVEQALIFHIGLGAFLAERSRKNLTDPETEEHVSASRRRFGQAIDGMNDAEESEDFQAVGVKCRDALLALGKEHAYAEWVGDIENPPKAADFKGWANILAERLTEAGRLRSYLKAIADKTWDLTVWLQHNSNATPVDADIVIEATGQVIGTFAKLIRRRDYGDPERCPRCESYRVRENVESDDDQMGFWESEVCASCGWQSEPVFTSFRDHLEGADLAAYLADPGIGVSDRLHRSREASDDPS
jgi:hypothetical protein